jgi:hypothetical protein
MSSSEQKSDEPEYLSAVESHALNPIPSPQHPQEISSGNPVYTAPDTTQNQVSYSNMAPAPNQGMTQYTGGSPNQPQYAMGANNNNGSNGFPRFPNAVQKSAMYEEGYHQEGLMSG